MTTRDPPGEEEEEEEAMCKKTASTDDGDVLPSAALRMGAVSTDVEEWLVCLSLGAGKSRDVAQGDPAVHRAELDDPPGRPAVGL